MENKVVFDFRGRGWRVFKPNLMDLLRYIQSLLRKGHTFDFDVSIAIRSVDLELKKSNFVYKRG